MPEIKLPARSFRAGAVLARAAPAPGEEDDRRVTLSFSSEEPVLRYYGWEILGHGEGEADFSRIASGRSPLLADHRQELAAQIGIVESARIVAGRGEAVVRFGRGALASEILARVRDGEVVNVSVGYAVTALAPAGRRDGEMIYRARWAPHEISLVSVPADTTVGIGRAAPEPGAATITLSLPDPESHMTPDEIAAAEAAARAAGAAATRAAQPAPAQPAAQTPAAAPADPLVAERARVKEIRAMAHRFNLPADMVSAAEERGVSAEAFQRQVLDHLGSDAATATRNKDAGLGLTEKEVKRFSILNAVRFLANPADAGMRAAAGFEIEVSEAAQQKLGRAARGILIPADVLESPAFARAQNVGTPAQGGNLVATDLLPGSFIELLRHASVLPRLGVRTLAGLVGNLEIPRQTDASAGYWIGEGDTPAESGLTFDKVALSPKTLASRVAITRRAMIQSTPDMEALVRSDMVAQMAAALDLAAIKGSGVAPVPRGLLNTSGILTHAFDNVSGPNPSYEDVIDMETALHVAASLAGSLKWLMAPGMKGGLRKSPVEEGHPEKIMTKGDELDGYPAVICAPAVLDADELIFGDWSQQILGLWSGLDLTVDTAALAASGGIVLRAFQDADFVVRQPKAFVYGSRP